MSARTKLSVFSPCVFMVPMRGGKTVEAPHEPERGCVRSTSRSAPLGSQALSICHALRLGLRPQPRSRALPGSATQAKADGQVVASEKFLGAQTASALALELQNAQSLFAAGDDDAMLVRAQNRAWMSRTLRFDFGRVNLQQAQLISGAKARARGGPGSQPSHSRPDHARRLRPVDVAIGFRDLPGVADALSWLRTRSDPAVDEVR